MFWGFVFCLIERTLFLHHKLPTFAFTFKYVSPEDQLVPMRPVVTNKQDYILRLNCPNPYTYGHRLNRLELKLIRLGQKNNKPKIVSDFALKVGK